MIVWSGLGFLVAVITLAVCFVMNYLLDGYFGKGFCASHDWLFGAALFIGGVLSAIVGFALNTPADREFLDARTVESPAVARARHTFFYIPMHWAGLIVAAGGIVKIVMALFA
jgi:hypothetical protein